MPYYLFHFLFFSFPGLDGGWLTASGYYQGRLPLFAGPHDLHIYLEFEDMSCLILLVLDHLCLVPRVSPFHPMSMVEMALRCIV